MSRTISQALGQNFLGGSPTWYKMAIVAFLVVNPIFLLTLGSFITGWIILLEFIFTLAMALKCYPLQPGGLLAIEAVVIGMATPDAVYEETVNAFPVIMLLMFMVAGIYFLRELLLFVFTKLLITVKSKIMLSVMFSVTAAFLSAFLDALTVTAVIITVCGGFYSVYHAVASGKQFDHAHDHAQDDEVHELHRTDLDEFRAFLRSLVMHAAVGTALGGVMTLVGEPQNLLIAEVAGWEFMEFFYKVAPVSIPVFFAGVLTCMALEKTKIAGYGTTLPQVVRDVLVDYDHSMTEQRTMGDKAMLIVQAFVTLFLIVSLANHLAAVGVIGLAVIILATALNGVTEEHRIGRAFEEALPFTALLVVFFAIVAVIHGQHLFDPITNWLLSLEGEMQTTAFYLANGFLSMISDNVFVATIYIGEVKQALLDGTITREQFDLLAVAINTGTNIPSVATPNGQAAFLFLLTSALAPLIRLSYGRMVIMALPYTITMTLTGLWAVMYLL